jgi:DNA invertase Pin-like site-specific DNA recombinase
MKEMPLKGKRYLNWVRCSSTKQSDTSISDQLALLNEFATRHGMVHIDDILVDGVTGSVPGARRDFKELIRRKESRNDFDVVLLQDTSRLTRAGNLHGAKVEFDLAAVGVKLVYATEDIPEGEHADLYKCLRYTQAKSQAVSISFTSTRGLMSALLDGRTAYCRSAPYGIDKLYVSPDNKPQHIIRLLADGMQLQLDPDTGAEMGRFERDGTGGKSAHYIKQKQERIMLVPGDPGRVETLRRIYARHYLDGVGAPRIARELNDDGIPGPKGGVWNVEPIRQILLNPVYRGISYANYSSAAIYHMRAPSAPQRVEVAASDLARRSRPPRRVRPRTDWIAQEHLALKNLLTPDIQRLAKRRQEAYLQKKAEGHIPEPNRDRHRGSEYLLKGILTTKQGGLRMSGRRSGTGSSVRRYYRATRAKSAPTSDPVLRKCVPAEPLERAVVALLQHVLTCGDFLERDVRAAVEGVQKRARSPVNDAARLRQQRDAVRKKLNFAIENLNPVGQDAARETLSRLQDRISRLDEQIRQAESTAPAPVDTQGTVARITAALSDMGNRIHELPVVELRRLLEAFVSNAVVDVETRHVQLELRLPESALGAFDRMGLDTALPWKPCIETHGDSDVLMLAPSLLWVQESHSYGAVDFAGAA